MDAETWEANKEEDYNFKNVKILFDFEEKKENERRVY